MAGPSDVLRALAGHATTPGDRALSVKPVDAWPLQDMLLVGDLATLIDTEQDGLLTLGDTDALLAPTKSGHLTASTSAGSTHAALGHTVVIGGSGVSGLSASSQLPAWAASAAASALSGADIEPVAADAESRARLLPADAVAGELA